MPARTCHRCTGEATVEKQIGAYCEYFMIREGSDREHPSYIDRHSEKITIIFLCKACASREIGREI